jgi:hypothetical protein
VLEFAPEELYESLEKARCEPNIRLFDRIYQSNIPVLFFSFFRDHRKDELTA